MIRAIDTNVVVRVLAEPDSPQYPVARALLADRFALPLSVVMETEWVLRSLMGWSRHRIAEALGDLLDLPTCESGSPELNWIIARFEAGADLADMIHLALVEGADCFATFDADLARRAGADAPVTIETLR